MLAERMCKSAECVCAHECVCACVEGRDDRVKLHHVTSSMTVLEGSDLFENKQTFFFFTSTETNRGPVFVRVKLNKES